MSRELLKQLGYIDGRWVAAERGATVPVTNPATGEVIATVPDMGASETRCAVEAAKRAMKPWAVRPAGERARVLRRFYELMMNERDALAELLTCEQGKPLREAKGEIAYAASYIEWFAEEAKRSYGDVIPGHTADKRIVVLKQPVGVVGAITPWNFPSAMITRKIGPALAAGCGVVLKPAPQTPLSALALASLARQAGLPEGALQVVTGDAATLGSVMTQDPRVAFLSFTGSTATGRLLYAQCADTIKKLGLELGGHAPFIVMADADIDKAATAAVAAKFRNSGQTCVCPNRFFIHDSIYDDFLGRFLEQVGRLVPGDGRDPLSTLGPLIDEAALAKLERHVADALANGARLTRGGRRAAIGRTWYEATVIEDVDSTMLVSCEETFGPVAALTRFRDLDEVKSSINASQYGLAGYIWGRDISVLLRTAETLDLGMVGINAIHLGLEMAPIGGVKQSGLGREGGHAGILEYCEPQYLLVAV